MAGKALPYDAEVEWIECSGTQYIDSGIIFNPLANNSLKIGLSFTSFGTSSAAKYIFGHTGGSKLSVNTYVGGVIYTYCGSNASRSSGIIPNFDIHELKIETSVDRFDFYFDEDLIESYVSGLPTVPINKNLIFGNYFRDGLNVDNIRSFIGRFYHIEMTENESMKFDLIPVRFTNENGESEGAMYNTLGVGGNNPDGTPRNDGLFRNAGTGDFIIGPDK